MVENIHNARCAHKDAVATLSSLEKSHYKKKPSIKPKSSVRTQVKNLNEKNKTKRQGILVSKKKYNTTTMKSKEKVSTKILKCNNMAKSKKSKITKKEMNETSIVKHKKTSSAKLRLSKNANKNNKPLGLKKKDVKGKRNAKEAKKKLKGKETRKKISAPKKITCKNPPKKNAKTSKKKSVLKTCVTTKKLNGVNGIKHINKHKINMRDDSFDTSESEGLEIIQVIADVHRIETDKDILRIDTNCDEINNKDIIRTDFPKEMKTNGSFEINEIECKFKENGNDVHKKSYTSLYDNIKRKERKSSQLAQTNQLSENKNYKSIKRKLKVSNTNESRSKQCNVKKLKLSNYMKSKS